MHLTVIYEDNHLIVVNKPSGLLTQPTDLEQNSLENSVKAWIKEKYHKPGNVFLGVVHRLDKPVSGIVLFAKTSKALSRLNAALRSRNCKKKYLAILEGFLSPEEGSLEHFLIHDDYRATVTKSEEKGAKKAILHYRLMKTFQGKSLVEIDLETGRYHQIRAQFSAMGHPVLGDKKYGSTQPYEEGSIALVHYRFEIEHPVTKKMMLFESPNAFTTIHQE